MVGIKFNDKHSFNDYGLILSSFKKDTAIVKSYTVDVAGGDSVLDYTEYFGEPKFKNRTLQIVFTKVHQTVSEFNDDWSRIQNDFNGKKFNITPDDDSEFFYIGRISLSYTRKKNITTITMKVEAEPYKMKNQNTVVSITGSGNVTLNNLRKKVVPTVKTTASTKLTFGTSVFNLSAGEWVLPEFELNSGANTVTVEGTGTTTFTYKEGGF